MTTRDEDIVAAIFELFDKRSASATICPSEVARSLCDDEPAWRALMADVRRVADDLAARGMLRVSARGEVVSALEAQGPIRLGRPR